MARPLSRPLHVTFLGLTALLVFSAAFAGLAQQGVQEVPLFRDDRTSGPNPFLTGTGSSSKGYVPNEILESLDAPVWIQRDSRLAISIKYECIDGYNDAGVERNDPDCDVGTAGSGATSLTRTATLYYNTSGGQPDTDNDPTIVLNSTAVHVGSAQNSRLFEGQISVSKLAAVQEGDELAFLMEVPLTGANTGCAGTGAGGAVTCEDPLHTTQQASYVVRLDDSVPAIVVTDPTNAEARRLTDSEWFLYSSRAMSNFLPALTVSVVDSTSGAPLDEDSITLYRAKTDNSTNFAATRVSDHGYSYTYQYPTGGARSFQDDTATRIDVRAKDASGHYLDTFNETNPAVWVVMDNSTPAVSVLSNQQGQGGSHLKRQPGATGLASLGEPMRIFVNATDVAGTKSDDSVLNTPREHLSVTVRFQGGPNNETLSDPITIPFNATACTGGCFFSDDARIPDDWVNGPTYANVTVEDPVGHSVTHPIQGSVSVDVSVPIVTPQRPIADDAAQIFTQDNRVTFELRATDPGDDDEWNGPNTQDTDEFGIDLDGVRVRYKIGEDGPLQSAQLTAQSTEDTFRRVNNFGSEDAVYYFLEVKDLAGNTATYPGANDPALIINSTANAGRFLLVHVDKRGPAIAPAKDLNYLGKGPHELSFDVTDAGIGVDPATVKLFWRAGTSGGYTELLLTREGQTDTYKGSIPTQTDGGRVQYYLAAADQLGNQNTYGSLSNPRTATIDLTAPVVTVNAPGTSTSSTLNVTWSATDTGSGIQDYSLQFRIAPGGSWFAVPERTNTTLTYYNICAATGKTYEFRVSARDRAGNERAFPETADASSFVDAATSCAQAPAVTISRPAQGAALSGTVPITWNAVSTTAPGDLSVSLQMGTGSAFETIARGLNGQGTYQWESDSLDVTQTCVPDGTHTLRVVAVDPNGLEGRATVTGLVLNNGITDCDDRDNDGLADAWEVANFGDLNQGPSDDDDGDGFNNNDEFRGGTDPNDSTSRPDLSGEGGIPVEVPGWSNLYILVILGFVAVLAVFVIGMTRRW